MKEGSPCPDERPGKLSEVSWDAKHSKSGWHPTGQQKAQRARIILKAAVGEPHTEIAQDLKVSIDMAALWRER
jgi:hypothetical protein